MSSGYGRGKVILLGEHAVVHGQPALAAALELGVKIEAEPASTDSLEVASWGLQTGLWPAVAAVKSAIGFAAPVRLTAHATVPARAGLGSSAALVVAVTRALAPAADDAEVERVANLAERVFHDNPSGVDVALAARGGIGLFRRGAGFERLDAKPIRLALGLSGESRSTAEQVAGVAARLAAKPMVVEPILARLGALASAGRDALNDTPALGLLFDEAHTQLRVLGVSTARLDELCRLARDAGALGAKLTGAGGGGAVIAVGDEDEIVAAWRAAGFTGFVVTAGAI